MQSQRQSGRRTCRAQPGGQGALESRWLRSSPEDPFDCLDLRSTLSPLSFLLASRSFFTTVPRACSSSHLSIHHLYLLHASVHPAGLAAPTTVVHVDPRPYVNKHQTPANTGTPASTRLTPGRHPNLSTQGRGPIISFVTVTSPEPLSLASSLVNNLRSGSPVPSPPHTSAAAREQ